jgi:hypothetical protein
MESKLYKRLKIHANRSELSASDRLMRISLWLWVVVKAVATVALNSDYPLVGGAALPSSAVISCSLFFNDSPTFANTCEQASRSFSSAVAEIPETTPRD